MARTAAFILLIVCLIATIDSSSNGTKEKLLTCIANCNDRQPDCIDGFGPMKCPKIGNHCVTNKTAFGISLGCLRNTDVKNCKLPHCEVCNSPKCNDPFK